MTHGARQRGQTHGKTNWRSPLSKLVRFRKVVMNSKHLVSLLLSLALLLSCLPANAVAQTTPTQMPAGQKEKSKKELERKALGLLDEIIKNTQSFVIPENRLRLQAVSASLLWKYDEARARLLFKDVMAGMAELLSSQEETDPLRASRMVPGAREMRREMAQIMAARDARLAREFLRATRTKPAERTTDNPYYSSYDSDIQLEYSLATQIVETDPKQALELAEDNLKRGYSYELMNTLKVLSEKDHDAAAKLAGDIVTKLRSENLATNNEAAGVAFNLMSYVLNPSGATAEKEAKKAEPLLSQQSIRELMEINVALALSSPRYFGQLQSLPNALQQVEKYAPARAAELRRRLAESKKVDIGIEEGEEDEDGEPEWKTYTALMEKGTPEELLAAAAKAGPGIREGLYQTAANKLAEKGELERARDILTNNLPDTPMRRKLLVELESKSSLTAAEQGKLDQVRKSLQNLKTNEERALALAQISTTLMAKGERKISRQLLDEAQGLVSYRAKNVKQLGAQLMIAQAYAKLEPERCLTILEPIVDQINELLAAAVTLGGFFLDEEMFRDDEIRLEAFMTFFPMLSGNFMPDLNALASFDFDRTKALADRFQRDEVRMMARLLVAQSVLGDEVKPGSPRGSMTTMVNTVPTTTEVVVDGETP